MTSHGLFAGDRCLWVTSWQFEVRSGCEQAGEFVAGLNLVEGCSGNGQDSSDTVLNGEVSTHGGEDSTGQFLNVVGAEDSFMFLPGSRFILLSLLYYPTNLSDGVWGAPCNSEDFII